MREEVYVPGTARFQVGAQLKEGDKRIKRIMKDLQPHLETPFGMNFYQRYREAFLLPEIPIDELAFRWPFEGPPKPAGIRRIGQRYGLYGGVLEMRTLLPKMKTARLIVKPVVRGWTNSRMYVDLPAHRK